MRSDHFEPTPSPGCHEGEDLYPFYVKYMETLRDGIMETMPPCPSRRRNLSACRTLPREQFEAKLEAVRARSEDFAALVTAFKRCEPLRRLVVMG